MKKCTYCGKAYPDAAASCPIDGQTLVSTTASSPTTKLRKPRTSKQVKGGLVVVLIGVAIVAFGYGLPILMAKWQMGGTIYVSLPVLILGSVTTVFGLAVVLVGQDGIKGNERRIVWMGFLAGIVLCILVFSKLFGLGYHYK